MRVRITPASLRTALWECLSDISGKLPESIELEGEVVKTQCTHSQHASGAMYCMRSDGCTYREASADLPPLPEQISEGYGFNDWTLNTMHCGTINNIIRYLKAREK